MLSGVVIVAASTVVKGVLNYDLGRNATVVIELAVGLAVGMAAQTARRAHAELERAARLAASHGGARTAVPPGARRRDPGAGAGVPPWPRNRR